MNSNTNNNAAAGQKEDYLDKGLDAAEKKFGGSMGQNTEKNRGVNEKIMEHATCSKKQRANTSRRNSQTKSSPPPRLSLDIEATNPPSTCYEHAHPFASQSPASPTSHALPRPHAGKRKEKRMSVESAQSAGSDGSFATAREEHGEKDHGEEKQGVLHKVADRMHKARPYVERLSGTYEPLPVRETGGTKS